MTKILTEEQLLTELKLDFCKYRKSILEDFVVKFPCEDKDQLYELEIIYHKDVCDELQRVLSKVENYNNNYILSLLQSYALDDLRSNGYYYSSMFILYTSLQELNKRWQRYKRLICFF